MIRIKDRIIKLTEFNREIRWDTSKPDGQPKRCLDVSRAKDEFGFEAKVGFREGLEKTIEWYRNVLAEEFDMEIKRLKLKEDLRRRTHKYEPKTP